MAIQGEQVLHVVNISFVLPYYIGGQFDYFQNKGAYFFVACYDDEYLRNYTKSKNIVAIPTNILREIDIMEDIKAIIKLIKEIKRREIGIVIAHTPKGALVGIIASYFAGVKKRIYFRHGIMYETSVGWKRRLLIGIERLTSRLATKVVCVSPSVLRKSIEGRLTTASKCLLLNKGTCNGVDAQVAFNKMFIPKDTSYALRRKYNVKGEDIVIGYVGRLVKDKGISELLAAWKQITAKNTHVKLLLVGPYEQRDSITEEDKLYIKQEGSIIHTGLIENVSPFYTLMEIFVLPSYREGFPTVVLEASAMEIPVITTKSTGCIDSIIENETGIFTEITAEDIASKIEFYIQHRKLAKEHGMNGRKFVLENFQQEVIWKEIEKKIFES